MSAEKRTDFQTLRRFWPFLEPFRVLLFTSVGLVPLISLVGLAPPFLLMHGIDVNLQGHPGHALIRWILTTFGLQQALLQGYEGLLVTTTLFFGSVGLEYVIKSLQTYALQFSGLSAIGALRRAIYRHITGQSARYFDRNPTGALLTRATSDVESLSESLTMGMVTLLTDVFNVLAITGFMLMLSPGLTLVTFLVAPVLVLVVNFFRRKMKVSFIEVRKTLAEVNGFMQEHLSGVRIVQLFAQEPAVSAQFKAKNLPNLKAAQANNIYDASLYAIMEGMASICIAMGLWYGGVQVIQGALTLGLLVAFIEYTQRLFVPVKEFSGKVAILQQAVAALERVGELLDTHQGISKGEREAPPAQGRLVFDDVSFAYSDKGGDVLKHVSFEVRPGQVIALVGATGSGKTTLGKLLTRSYEGYRGSIRFEGEELSALTPASVRRQVGVVHQDVTLFTGTIAFNIGLGNPNITQAQVEAAAKLVQAHAFIQRLPGGYAFEVAERGANLSAGQAQLLAFARLMAHDPPIVVLDEATAAIDSQTEALIQQAVEAVLSRKTALVIAHRLSTIERSDQILVLHLGELVEAGTHAELLAKNGIYARLSQSGFSDDALSA